MSGEVVFLIAATFGLAVRALWLSGLQHRHVGWVSAGSFAAGWLCVETVASNWPMLAFLAVFLVSEFVAQTGASSTDEPPAKWMTPILKRLPGGPIGRHQRDADDGDR